MAMAGYSGKPLLKTWHQTGYENIGDASARKL